MPELIFAYFVGRVWSLDRFQPNIFLCDEQEIPFDRPRDDGQGLIAADLPENRQASLHLRWPVPSFGEVTLSTALCTPSSKPYNLHVEIARQRLSLIKAFCDRWCREGFRPSAGVAERIRQASTILEAVSADETERVNARWGDLSISISLPASEELALECARFQMSIRRANDGFRAFLLGCNFFQYPQCHPAYTEYFTKLFNYATLPFYWAGFEPQPGVEFYVKVDMQADYLKSKHITMKGHPLLWFNTMPDYVPLHNLERLKELLYQRVKRITSHYDGIIGIWDVINEMQHAQPYTDDATAVDLTRFMCDCVKELAPGALRVVNVDEPFGEYMACQPEGKLHPITYFERLAAETVDYDVIGIQFYQGSGWTFTRDLFEMSRYLDRYEKFGKPIHITELGVPSKEGYDQKDYSWRDHGAIFPKGLRFLPSDAGFWRQPWSQETQADWVEGFYRILMGKPFVQGITWWDFTDESGHFYSHAGLLDENLQPKLAYKRLMSLKKEYLDETGGTDT